VPELDDVREAITTTYRAGKAAEEAEHAAQKQVERDNQHAKVKHFGKFGSR
jgi:hypothetical protein